MTLNLQPIPHGGTLFYDIVGGAATGTGVARVAINATYTVPQEARELNASLPWMLAAAPAVGESVFGVFDIQGTGFKRQPQEFWGPLGGSRLEATWGQIPSQQPLWEQHHPLAGGETPWSWGIEPIDALADDGRCGLTLAYSTGASEMPYVQGISARELSTGTTAVITNLTTLALQNPKQMVEAGGFATGSTVTADQEIEGIFTVTCQAWQDIQTHRFFAVLMAIEATSGGQVAVDFPRLPFDARFKGTGTINVTGTYELVTTLTAAGQFAHYLRYI